MLKGIFYENTPYIKIIVGWGQSVQTPFFILDTGFTGDLQVTPKIAEELGLTITGVTPVRLADNQIINVPTALAIASMEGLRNFVQVLIVESMPLAGISLLSKFKYRATFDCKYKTLDLERGK